jgi:hypothetical protein
MEQHGLDKTALKQHGLDKTALKHENILELIVPFIWTRFGVSAWP